MTTNTHPTGALQMDILQEATKQYEEAFRAQSKVVQPFIHELADRAHLYAAIAQAEQLKRIADALENMSGAYTAATFGYYGTPAKAEPAEAQYDDAQLWINHDYGVDDPSHYVQPLDE